MVVRSPALPAPADGRGEAGKDSSPRNVVGDFDLKDVPTKWDNDPAIRERMRNGDNLCLSWDEGTGTYMSKYVDPTIDNLKINGPVLKPIVTIMGRTGLQIPSITALIDAVDAVFKLAKLNRTSDHHYQEAWAIRRQIAKLKRFTYRSSPPQDRLPKN